MSEAEYVTVPKHRGERIFLIGLYILEGISVSSMPRLLKCSRGRIRYYINHYHVLQRCKAFVREKLEHTRFYAILGDQEADEIASELTEARHGRVRYSEQKLSLS